MRREHRSHIESEHRAFDLLRRVAVALEVAHRPLRRRRLRLGVFRRRAIGARSADAVHLLGGVDEQEEERERARRDRRELEGERFDLGEELVERGRVGVAVASRAAGAAQRLDRLERQLTLEAADDAAERAGEPSDVLVEGDVLAADRRAGNRDSAERGGGAGPTRPLTGLVRRVRQGASSRLDGQRGASPSIL
jgi:hypothetical protein